MVSSSDLLRPSQAQVRRPRRAVRPCDLCRLRKSRCVLLPGSRTCTVCQSRQTACTFDQKPPPRPVRSRRRQNHDLPPSPGMDIVSGQVHWNLAPNTISAQPPGAHAPRSGVQQPSVLSGASETRSPPLSVRSRQSIDAQGSELRNVLGFQVPIGFLQNGADNDGSLGMAKSRFAELYGLTSDMEPILMRHRPYDPERNEFCLETHSIRRVLRQDMGMQYPVTFHVAKDEKAIGYRDDYAEHDEIERCVAPYGPSLLNIFWRIVHPCYPILYRRGFMESYAISYREIAASLLGAVYLISLNWWAYDRELSNKPSPDASRLRKGVIKAIQNSYHRPRLSSIEATLLLLQCKPEDALNPDHTWTWGYTSQALSIGEAMGLHLDASSWAIPEWERGLRKRLSWALYMQDKWTALVHGRPSHIHDDNWGVTDITDADFADLADDGTTGRDDVPCTDVETGRLEFLEMVTLSKILSEILFKFFSLRACNLQDTVKLYEDALPLLEKLRSWHEHLSPSLLMIKHTARQLSANGFLHLSYHGLVLTLLRRVIRSTALAPLCSDVAVLNQSRKLASESAQDAISFVLMLRPDHLEAFWFFASGFNFSLVGSFITLLLVTSRSEAEKTHWRESLTDHLWNLRVMGKASEPMLYAVNRLEGAILRGMEHALAVNIASEDPPNDRHVASPSRIPPASIRLPLMVEGSATADQMSLPVLPTTTSNSLGDWLTPLINEDLTSLDLEQFDWLAGT